MTLRQSRDPRMESPDDLDAIADALPAAPRSHSFLRRMIGLLPNPIGPTFPRGADSGEPPADPQEAMGGGIGYQPGLGTNSGGSGFNPGSIPGSALTPGSVSGGAIQANAITATHIQAGSITAGKIAAGAITAGTIAADSITAFEIATASITGVELADGTVSDVKISSVSANKITAGTITAVVITASSITAGGGGYNGLVVVNGSGGGVGAWDSGGFTSAVNATFSGTLQVNGGSFFNGYLDATAASLGTRVVAGAHSNVFPNTAGQLGIDSANGRFYFHHSGGWHYAAQTAGFEIPSWETDCPACGKQIELDAAVVGRIVDAKDDGARHGLYVHFKCAERKLDPTIVAAALLRSREGQSVAGPPQGEPDAAATEARSVEAQARIDAAIADKRRDRSEAAKERG